MKLLLGKPIAEKIYQKINLEKKRSRVKPGLATIMIGKNKASQIYVHLKEKIAKKLGFYFKKYLLPTKTNQITIFKIINQLNKNQRISGIIIQLPLPKHLKVDEIVKRILPTKDVDGFHPKTKFVPPVHQAVLALLKSNKIKLSQKKVLILSKNLIFAKPLEKLLKKERARVKIILKPSLKEIKKADTIIIALGQPKFLKGEMIKKEVVIIDIGFTRVNKKAVGDTDRKSCFKKVAAISPIPGGIGPLTIAFLMKNTLKAAKKSSKF